MRAGKFQQGLQYLTLALAAGLLPACADWRLHEPALQHPAQWDGHEWLLQCETPDPIGEPAPHAILDPQPAPLWGRDQQGALLRLRGHLEDGYFVLHTVYAGSGQPLPTTRSFLRTRCSETLHDHGVSDNLDSGQVWAARDGEGIQLPIYYPEQEASPQQIRRLVIFGDSLSDTGRLKRRVRVFPTWPYWMGRFSNGPIWTEYLEQATALSVQNHAYGGASLGRLGQLPGADWIARVREEGQYFISGSIGGQVEDYVNNYLVAGQLAAPDKTAFLIWAGANDYISKEPVSGLITTFLNNPAGESGYQSVVHDGISGLESAVRALYDAGGRNFVLLNLPDLGRSPVVTQNTTYIPVQGITNDPERRLELSQKLSELTRYHNQQLVQAVDRLNSELNGGQIALFDSNRLFLDLAYADEPRQQIAPRWTSVTVSGADRSLNLPERCYAGSYFGSRDDDRVCLQPKRMLFWDAVHPTTTVHCLHAAQVAQHLAREGWMPAQPPLSCEGMPNSFFQTASD